MFRRRKSMRHAPLNTNPSPSAQTAAVQAFRASQNTTPSLSSSAAAAALRSHTPPPTAVKDVQTKRMLQRKQSTSSINSSRANTLAHGKDGGLRRTRSSGSMATRTFRDQSPARAGSAASNPAEIIPVPPLPRAYATSPPPQGAGSTELQSYQGISPPSRGRRARSVSNSSSGIPDLERHGSRNSINFSYPINRPNSPRLSIASADSPRRNGPSSPRSQHQLSTEQASGATRPLVDRPIPNKAVVSELRPAQVDQGTQVAEDLFDKISATPLSGIESDNSGRPQADRQMVTQAGTKPSPSTLTDETQADGHGDIHHTHGSLSSPTLARRPSTVLELQEDAENEQPYKTPVKNLALHADKQPQSDGPTLVARQKDISSTSKVEPLAHIQQIKGQEALQSHVQGPIALPPQITPHIRPHSLSPNRLTRFSEHLEIPESEKQLHHPPPRSLSPAKPALKSTSNSSLAARPERLSCLPGNAGSETSEGTSLVSDDGSRAGSRKKHAKVSFEDETEVIGHGVSPHTSPESLTSSSPQAHLPSRPWSDSLVRSKSRGDDSNEFELFFTPRPALPSFGSIRGRKPSRTRDIETDSKLVTEIHSPSDHATGESISTTSTRNEDKRDTNHNLPLPPEVTSLEGTGYSSLSEDSSSDEGADLRYFPPRVSSRAVSASRSIPDGQTVQAGASQPRQTEGANNLSPTPAIFIQPATPAMEEVTHCEQSSPQIPKAENEPTQQESTPYFSTNEAKSQDQEEKYDDSDSGNSVYSDAYEDLSDIEGDGFGSIDAIVDRSVDFAPEPLHSSTVHSLPPESEQRDLISESNDKKEAPRVAEAAPETQLQPITQYPSTHEQPKATEKYDKGADMPATDPLRASEKPLFEEYPRTPPITAVSYTSSSIGPSGQFDRHSPTLHPILESNGVSEEKPVKINTKTSTTQRPRRTMSNASDSSSSFKRPKRFRPTGRYTLRKTMRGSSPSNNSMEVLSDGGLPSKSFDYSLRHRPFSSSDSRPMMRTTLRQAPSTSTSRFSALTGRGKNTRTNGFSGRPRRVGSERAFKSRYEDSSDDEVETIKLRPVRGIPKRKNEVEGDSTDLDDSSEYETTKHVLRRKRSNKGNSKNLQDPAVAAAIAKLTATKGVENTTTVTAGHDQPIDLNGKYKSGLLGRLHLSKHKPRHRELATRQPELESPSRRDMPQEQSPTLPHEDYSKPTTTTAINGRILEPSGNDWQSVSPKLQKRSSTSIHRPAVDSWPLRSNGHAAFALPSSPSASEKARPSVLPMQDISNGKDSHPRPRTADGVATQNNTRHVIENPTPSNPLSPTRGDRPAWTSRFRSSRRGTDNHSTASAISDVHLSSLRTEIPKREKKGRFPKLKKVFGIA